MVTWSLGKQLNNSENVKSTSDAEVKELKSKITKLQKELRTTKAKKDELEKESARDQSR